MPELPEVEIARSLIADQALHRRIVDVDDSDSYVARPHAPGELRSALTGRSLTAAHRRGKTMWLETSGTGDAAEAGPDLGIHLGMSGRIVVTAPDGTVAEGGVANGGPPDLVRRVRQMRNDLSVVVRLNHAGLRGLGECVDDMASRKPWKVIE